MVKGGLVDGEACGEEGVEGLDGVNAYVEEGAGAGEGGVEPPAGVGVEAESGADRGDLAEGARSEEGAGALVD